MRPVRSPAPDQKTAHAVSVVPAASTTTRLPVRTAPSFHDPARGRAAADAADDKLSLRWPSRTTRRSATSPRRPSRRRGAPRRRVLLLHPEARGVAAPLRLPPGAGRRPAELGRAEGPVLRSAGQAARDARRGPPGRVRLLRRRDPGGRVRGGGGRALGPRDVDARRRSGPRAQEGRAEVRAARREARGQVGARQDQGRRPEGVAPRQGQGRARADGGRAGHRERAAGERRHAGAASPRWPPSGTDSGTRRWSARAARWIRAGPPRATAARACASPTSRAPCAGRCPQTQPLALAMVVEAPPDGDEWLHEIKHDGYRIVARIEEGEVRLVSRNGKDWTKEFPQVARAVGRLPAGTALLDGEVAAVLPNGATSFQALQRRGRRSGAARLLRLRPAAPRRLGPAAGEARGAQGGAAAPARVGARGPALQRSRARPGPRVLREGARGRPRGCREQARRRSLSRGARRRLAEGEVPADARRW